MVGVFSLSGWAEKPTNICATMTSMNTAAIVDTTSGA
jgi:hypothetical protein